MHRETAITIICQKKIDELTKEEKKDLLLSWWNIDSEDDEFSQLSYELQQELLVTDEPLDDIDEKKYDSLLLVALKSKYFGVRNDYLSNQVSSLVSTNIKVDGEQESLLSCPCCYYQTLKERGQYLICSVCFWEDDGNNDMEIYSFVNHMFLSEGRANFKKFGTCSKLALINIESDVQNRYYLSD